MPSASVTINTTQFVTEIFQTGKITSVNQDMFGAININQGEFDDFKANYQHLNLSLLRWPGGTMAEDGRVEPDGSVRIGGTSGNYAYDLKNPELIDPFALSQKPDLSTLTELLAFALETQSGAEIILPTERYTDDPAEAYADVSAFLNRLFIEGAYNGGKLPENIILDIGNENYIPADYGSVAVEIMRAIRDFRDDHPGVEFKVAMQIMRTGSETQAMADEFNNPDLSPAYDNLLAGVDIVRVHDLGHALPSSAVMEDQTERYWAIKRLTDAIANAGKDANAIELGYSAWTSTSDDVSPGLKMGLPAASAMLSLFAGMIEMGADNSSTWGVSAFASNAYAMTYPQGGTQYYSPSAEVYRQMAESLTGTSLIATAGLDDDRGGTAMNTHNLYAYADGAKSVIFLSANDLTEPLDVTLNLEGFGDIGYVWIERVNTAPGSDSGQAIVTRESVPFTGSQITISLFNDYEVIRVIVAEAKPGTGYLHLWGSAAGDSLIGGVSADLLEGNGGNDTINGGNGADILSGDDGNDKIGGGNGEDSITGGNGNDVLRGDLGSDTVSGGAGADTINGGFGNDKLYGGAGVDRLNGDVGNDRLFGGSDADVFIFSGTIGVDRIGDFERGQDKIDLSGTDIGTWAAVQSHWANSGGNVVITISTGNTITIEGVLTGTLTEADFMF